MDFVSRNIFMPHACVKAGNAEAVGSRKNFCSEFRISLVDNWGFLSDSPAGEFL